MISRKGRYTVRKVRNLPIVTAHELPLADLVVLSRACQTDGCISQANLKIASFDSKHPWLGLMRPSDGDETVNLVGNFDEAAVFLN